MNHTQSGFGRRGARGALLAMLLAGSALGGFAAAHAGYAADGAKAIAVPQVTGVPDFTDLAAQVSPAVVSITSKIAASPASDEMPMIPGLPMPRRQFGEARGSGFIIDGNGTIVTNNHVVRNAREVSVTLDNGTVLAARVIGHDPRTDIAILKVQADHPLPFLQLGDSAKLKPGAWVVAMGNPFGLGGTVTAGIVSALNRDIGEGPYDQFIQIDAPINQGNSGGPLFNQAGQVVGINTAIYSPTGGSVGIGFAIPSNMVKTVVAQLQQDGHVTRGYVGVQTQALTPELAQALQLPSANGALIAAVEADTPASRAGLKAGDVVRSVDGKSVADPRALALAVSAIRPGDKVTLGVLRDGTSREMTVAVARMPSEQTASADMPNADASDHPRIGVALAPVGADGETGSKGRGALVAAVSPDSPADQAGIQPGDIITSVDSKPVATPEQAVKAIRSAESGKVLALRLKRDGHAMFVAVPLDKKAQG